MNNLNKKEGQKFKYKINKLSRQLEKRRIAEFYLYSSQGEGVFEYNYKIPTNKQWEDGKKDYDEFLNGIKKCADEFNYPGLPQGCIKKFAACERLTKIEKGKKMCEKYFKDVKEKGFFKVTEKYRVR